MNYTEEIIKINMKITIIVHDIIVFSGTITKENIEEVQKIFKFADSWYID